MNRSDQEPLCDEALELIEPYLDGDLSPAGSSGLRTHLERCPSCAAELELAAKIQRELRSLPQLDCPPEVVERVRDAGRGEVVPFRPRRALGLRIAAAAAVLLLAMLGKVTRRTSRNLREEVLEKRLVEPANRSVFRSLGEIPSLTAEPAAVDERSGKEL
jgi:anti-sigma factor RsiW